MARALAVGDIVTTDDRPLDSKLSNRKGVIVRQYNAANLPEWWVKWLDGQVPEMPDNIVHEKFLTPMDMDELLQECKLNMLIVRHTTSSREARRARILAWRAAERFQSLISEYRPNA